MRPQEGRDIAEFARKVKLVLCDAAQKTLCTVPLTPLRDGGFCCHHAPGTFAQPGAKAAGSVQPAMGHRRARMAYDNEGPRPISQASAKGRVKWFNPTKGYGFITLDNGGDAFCHASALQALGHADVPPGTTIVCDLTDSQRGLQVVTVHDVDTSTAEAAAPHGPGRFGHGGFHDSGPAGPMVEGRIKFFNDQKGFGFVMPDNGSGDIYLHASALRRSGIQAVEPEQRIRYSTRQGHKGVEVDRVEIIA